jgi:hypothetical protein
MIGRNKRGIRGTSTRVRLAVAAAVLVGGGAAAVVGVAASHGGATAATSAGYYSSTLSTSHAMSDAMNVWNKSPQASLSLIARMTPMSNVKTTSFHTHTLALQRGTVVAEERNAFVIKSANHQLELWNVTRGTKFLNVFGNNMGMNALTGNGGSMAMPNHMSMSRGARVLTRGDLVFIFGEKVHGQLVAQLVLFVAPLQVTTTPTATPSFTATATARPTSTTPAPTTTVTVTATPASTVPNTTVNGTPAVSSTHS